MVRRSSCIFPASCLVLLSQLPSNISPHGTQCLPSSTITPSRRSSYAPPLSPQVSQIQEKTGPNTDGNRTMMPAAFPPQRSTGGSDSACLLYGSHRHLSFPVLCTLDKQEDFWEISGWGKVGFFRTMLVQHDGETTASGRAVTYQEFLGKHEASCSSGEPSVFALGARFNFSPLTEVAEQIIGRTSNSTLATMQATASPLSGDRRLVWIVGKPMVSNLLKSITRFWIWRNTKPKQLLL